MNPNLTNHRREARSKMDAAKEYVVERFDYHRVTEAENSQIQKVYEVNLTGDLGYEFDPKLDADFQNPLKYYVPEVGGAYVVVRRVADRAVVGTCALRTLAELGPNTIELKRMFLLPEARGKGLAKHMMHALLHAAKELGCKRLVLDTNKRLVAANAVYEKFGLVDCPRYNDNPRPDRFMELKLE